MTLPFISKLPANQQKELLDDLNYLNTAEIKSFCDRHSIPYRIALETRNGVRRRTKEMDRKGVMLDRIRHFLETGVILQETCFPANTVCFDALPQNLAADDRLFYGQYEKTNLNLIAFLKTLTEGQFEDGAIARMLARHFWSNGKAPTLREFASAWIGASREHARPNPEWAFLSDRARGTAVSDWKSLRALKASRVIEVLDRISTSNSHRG